MAWTAPRTWVVGEIVTAALLNTHVRDNLKFLWHEVSYDQITAGVSSTATTEGTATTVISSSAVTYDGAQLATVEFFSPDVLPASSATEYVLGTLWYTLNGGADVIVGRFFFESSQAANVGHRSVFAVRRLVPPAGSVAFRVKIQVNGGTSGSVGAGAGGAATLLPAFVRVLRRDP
jgi:hypothetical protein